MKIGIVCYPTYGGSGVIATELGLGLAKRKHEVHFITYRMPPRITGFQSNVTYHEVIPFEYPLFEYSPYESTLASTLVEVVEQEGLEILHVHYAIPHATVAYLAQRILETKGIKIPIITTLHGTDISLVGSDPAFASVVEFSINQSNGVTAVSNYLKSITNTRFEIDGSIEVIYNFVDLKRFQRSKKDHYKLAIAPQGERLISHVSNFRPVKRLEDLVYAFYKIQQKLACKLLMIGDGPERQKINALCNELGIQERVLFLGKQDAIEDLLSISDLFMLPSASESFGLSALEAMACKVPVISSDAGGLPEINIDGKTGYCCTVGDIDALAAGAIELLTDDLKYAKFSNAALAQAQNFDIEKVIPQYEKFYEQFLP